MPRATTKKTAPVKKTKITVKKPEIVTKEVTLQQRLSSFATNIKASRSSSDSKMPIPKIKKRILLPILGLIVLIGLGYLASRYLVIAWVDQKPITRWDYYNQLDKKYGSDMREQMITEALIDSEAQKRHVSASPQEITDEINKIETEQGGPDKLDQVLQQQGITRPELTDLVRLQILRQKMFGDQATVTDDEVNQYIAENKDSLPPTDPNDASAEANLQSSVRDQLMQQKINATFSAWLQQNINSDRVIRL